jgi:hypothetical protein
LIVWADGTGICRHLGMVCTYSATVTGYALDILQALNLVGTKRKDLEIDKAIQTSDLSYGVGVQAQLRQLRQRLQASDLRDVVEREICAQ